MKIGAVEVILLEGVSESLTHFLYTSSKLLKIQRQAREFVSGPHTDVKTRLLSFNRTQSRVVVGLLTGHNTLRRHLHIMGLSDSPFCRKCGAEETSAHVLCECEALVHTDTYLGSFFLDREDVRGLSLGAIWNLHLCRHIYKQGDTLYNTCIDFVKFPVKRDINKFGTNVLQFQRVNIP